MGTGRLFGLTSAGAPVMLYTITDAAGNSAELISYGAAIRSLLIRDRSGRPIDVCLGYDSAREYERGSGCFGAVMGRCVNRIAGSRFALSGREYPVSPNRGDYHIHGGYEGFHKKNWRSGETDGSVTFTYLSSDGEEGYPGRLETAVRYAWEAPGVLSVAYDAVSDRETLINLTNHCYFNLDGHGSGRATGETAWIAASETVRTGRYGIPDGGRISVAGTPLDLRSAAVLEDRLPGPAGFDHCYLPDKSGMRAVAGLRSAESGIGMTVETDLPALQLYTAGGLSAQAGKGGAVYGPFGGVCLETEYVPNAVNLTGFDKPVFAAGEHFRHTTRYIFSA